MEKLNKIPHKFLFYFGLFIVLIFLSLSYWQFTSFQNDKITLNEFKNKFEIIYLLGKDDLFFKKIYVSK